MPSKSAIQNFENYFEWIKNAIFNDILIGKSHSNFLWKFFLNPFKIAYKILNSTFKHFERCFVVFKMALKWNCIGNSVVCRLREPPLN